MKLGLGITAALCAFANAVQPGPSAATLNAFADVGADEYKPKSVEGRMLQESTVGSYQRKLLKFKLRLINCKIHQRYFKQKTLGSNCKAIIKDFEMMYDNSVEKLDATCQITEHYNTVPCFHQMF